MTNLTLTITEQAQKVLQNQRQQVEAASRAWIDSPDHLDPILKMSESLVRCYAQVFTNGFGDSTIIGSDELSLEVIANTGYTIGMVFFPKDYPRPDEVTDQDTRPGPAYNAPRMGRYCMHDIAGIGYCRQPIVKGEHREHAEHAPDPYAMPILGDWSLHS